MNPLFQTFDPTLYGSDMSFMPGLVAAIGAFFIVFLVLIIALYVYMALAMMKTAQRLKVEPAWLAWIPIANFYLMLKMAKMPGLWMLLLIGMFIPFLGVIASIALMVVGVIAQYKVCEARQRPGWWAILTIIPVIGGIWSLVMWGILAWGK